MALSVVKQEAGEVSTEPETIGSNKYRQIMGLREVHFLSIFALIYVGVEVTIGSTCGTPSLFCTLYPW